MICDTEMPWITQGSERPKPEWGNYCYINNPDGLVSYIQVVKNKSLYLKFAQPNGCVTNVTFSAENTQQILDFVNKELRRLNKEDNKPTAVMFRKERNGQTLAVFPYLSFKHNYQITCYAHLGQHSYTCWEYVMKETEPAAIKDYDNLYEELRSIGYKLRIIKRASHRKMYQL